jgi:hypothetical protein
VNDFEVRVITVSGEISIGELTERAQIPRRLGPQYILASKSVDDAVPYVKVAEPGSE